MQTQDISTVMVKRPLAQHEVDFLRDLVTPKCDSEEIEALQQLHSDNEVGNEQRCMYTIGGKKND